MTVLPEQPSSVSPGGVTPLHRRCALPWECLADRRCGLYSGTDHAASLTLSPLVGGLL